MIARAIATSVAVACLLCAPARAQRYSGADGNLRVASEVMAHQNKVPNGPSSEQLAALFEQIFSRYPKASAIGFATIPSPKAGSPSRR